LATIDHIFSELRYFEDRARVEEGTRDTRLATLVALSGAVLGLLAASLPGKGLSVVGTVLFCLSILLFALALLVATQFVIRLPFLSRPLGGLLETVPEVGLRELDSYLTPQFQAAEQAVLQRRALPAMSSAIAARRRNAARKERCLDLAVWLIAAGIVAAAAYAAILVL
jgi:hypothetical protein